MPFHQKMITFCVCVLINRIVSFNIISRIRNITELMLNIFVLLFQYYFVHFSRTNRFDKLHSGLNQQKIIRESFKIETQKCNLTKMPKICRKSQLNFQFGNKS